MQYLLSSAEAGNYRQKQTGGREKEETGCDVHLRVGGRQHRLNTYYKQS